MSRQAAEVASATDRLAENARRKLGSAATSWYQRKVNPVGSSVFSHRSPNEPVNSKAIGSAR